MGFFYALVFFNLFSMKALDLVKKIKPSLCLVCCPISEIIWLQNAVGGFSVLFDVWS